MTLLNITRTSANTGTGTLAGRPSAMKFVRWGAQGLLAALFLFAGGMKFAMPVEVLTADSPFPAWFLQAIGVLEVLGALGLLASVAGRRLGQLVRPAAIGLALIMVGATVSVLATGGGAGALFPAVVGLLLAWVAANRA